MTTVASIIKSALRETNLIPLGVTPNADQMDEAFQRLSVIVAGTLGSDAGENLSPLPLGRNEISSPQGYPWWDNDLPGNIFLPTNLRVMCNLTAPGLINLHPMPHDGARMGVVDVSHNFDIHPLTIVGNGRSIEGEDAMTYADAGLIKEWVYREDLGNWVVVKPLDATGDMPWPEEFDDMFIIMLAMRLNPRYGQVMHPASMMALKMTQGQFQARYTQTGKDQPSEDGLTYLTGNYRLYGQDNRQYGDPTAFFNSGWVS